MTISDLENKIRDFINSGRRQAVLLNDTAAWNRLCCSLDLIGDTQYAIDAYPQFKRVQDEGASYLIVYGILQTLMLQQEAVKHIGSVLDIKVKFPKELESIRVIRSNAAGHPMNHKENGASSSCFIPRYSISPTDFELMTVYSENKDINYRTVSIPSLIEKQNKYLSGMLGQVITELEKHEIDHRNMHKDNKLVDIFPQSIDYHLRKIREATNNGDMFPIGATNVKIADDCVESFKKELLDRGEWGVSDPIDYHYELIKYPLNRLMAYFTENDNMNKKDAYIFASFVVDQFEILIDFAIEIDKKYETAP